MLVLLFSNRYPSFSILLSLLLSWCLLTWLSSTQVSPCFTLFHPCFTSFHNGLFHFVSPAWHFWESSLGFGNRTLPPCAGSTGAGIFPCVEHDNCFTQDNNYTSPVQCWRFAKIQVCSGVQALKASCRTQDLVKECSFEWCSYEQYNYLRFHGQPGPRPGCLPFFLFRTVSPCFTLFHIASLVFHLVSRATRIAASDSNPVIQILSADVAKLEPLTPNGFASFRLVFVSPCFTLFHTVSLTFRLFHGRPSV